MIALYRALLHLYPKSFRAEYGDEMCAVFAREVQSTGAGGFGLVIRALVDVVTNAARVHLDILRQDLKHATRSLRRTPGFAITAIAVAALGIGATTATFSIADHVLFRPMGFHEPDRLVRVWETQASRPEARIEPSPPNYRDWKRLAASFDAIEAFVTDTATVTGHGDTERHSGARVSGGLFRVLGRQAAIGRGLIESDITTATPNAVVISDAFWRLRLSADADVLGRTITLDDVPHVIVGVMPPDFLFPTRGRHFWRPLRLNESSDERRGNNYLEVLARLAPGVTIEQAQAEMRAIGEQLRQQYPQLLGGAGVRVGEWREEVGAQPRQLLLALAGASICVLLIACTNLANLLLARALSRRTEFAVRAAVGASVDRLARQMFTDSVLLALCGGILGVVIASVSAPVLMRLIPADLPIAAVPPVDLRLLALAAAITAATCVAFGVAPSLRACRHLDGAALKAGVLAPAGRSEFLRSAFVVVEIAMSVVLLVSAGLLFQALVKVQHVDPGFRADNVLTLRTTLPRPKYNRAESRRAYYVQVLEQVHALPGVRRAAYTTGLPMVTGGGIREVLSTTPDPDSPERFKPLDLGPQRPASLRFVTPGYFAAIGTPIVRGRDVSADDTLRSPFVVVVSESFVRQYLPNVEPLGYSFAFAYDVRTIVGVAGDVRVRGPERESEPQVYAPEAQMRSTGLLVYAPQDLVISASVAASTLIPAIRSIVQEAEPQLPITNFQELSDVVAAQSGYRQLQVRLVTGFASAAFVLAAIGIHGLLAFAVSARTREIGVRIALGAHRASIVNLVIGRSARLVAIGLIIGVPIAYTAARSIQSLLFGVSPASLPVFAAAAGVALVMSLAGSVLPAWRAVRVDPLTAIRSE